MENKRTLKEKLWDKGKYFVPLYGSYKAADLVDVGKRKTAKKIAAANLLGSFVLAGVLGVYGAVGARIGNFNPIEQYRYVKGQEQRKQFIEQMDEKGRQEYEQELECGVNRAVRLMAGAGTLALLVYAGSRFRFCAKSK